MRIIGIGLDAIEIGRVRSVLARHGPRFLHRVYTAGEVEYCRRHHDPAPSLAARFAAKEAAMKALGTGAAAGVGWRHIEVVRHHGPPSLRFHGDALRRMEAIGAGNALVTLTHTKELALAQVILMGR